MPSVTVLAMADKPMQVLASAPATAERQKTGAKRKRQDAAGKVCREEWREKENAASEGGIIRSYLNARKGRSGTYVCSRSPTLLLPDDKNGVAFFAAERNCEGASTQNDVFSPKQSRLGTEGGNANQKRNGTYE